MGPSDDGWKGAEPWFTELRGGVHQGHRRDGLSNLRYRGRQEGTAGPQRWHPQRSGLRHQMSNVDRAENLSSDPTV